MGLNLSVPALDTRFVVRVESDDVLMASPKARGVNDQSQALQEITRGTSANDPMGPTLNPATPLTFPYTRQRDKAYLSSDLHFTSSGYIENAKWGT